MTRTDTAVVIVPSILSADFTKLGDQVLEAEAAGADRLQIDVMDGQFVPNISMGPLVVAAVRRVTTLPIEVHLMILSPERFIANFIEAGASLIQVQPESTRALYRTLMAINDSGLRSGVAISPATPLESLFEILPAITQVNIMSVEPGFGGQQFIVTSQDKIRRLRQMAPSLEIEVDGGIDERTAPLAVAAGANALVAGSAIFAHPDGIAAGIQAIRAAVG